MARSGSGGEGQSGRGGRSGRKRAEDPWLPLFPLDLALLPGALLPLHVFEPRYRALARRALEGGRPFGVVRLHEGNLARVGCVAHIVQVLQAYPDGRSDILVRGEERFFVLDLREHEDGYLEARTEAVHDEPDSAPDPEDGRLLEQLFRQFAELIELEALPGLEIDTEDLDEAEADVAGMERPDVETADAEATEGGAERAPNPEVPPETEGAEARPGDEPGSGTDARQFTFILAARVPLGTDERQALLETLSERERTTAMLGLLARLLPRYRTHEKDRRKVRGNGKPILAEE